MKNNIIISPDSNFAPDYKSSICWSGCWTTHCHSIGSVFGFGSITIFHPGVLLDFLPTVLSISCFVILILFYVASIFIPSTLILSVWLIFALFAGFTIPSLNLSMSILSAALIIYSFVSIFFFTFLLPFMFIF